MRDFRPFRSGRERGKTRVMSTYALVVDDAGRVNCPVRGDTNVELCFGCQWFEDLHDLSSDTGRPLPYKELACGYRPALYRLFPLSAS